MDINSPPPSDLSARPDGNDLTVGGPTVWPDGRLAAMVRPGAICGLDEVVEARQYIVYRNLPH